MKKLLVILLVLIFAPIASANNVSIYLSGVFGRCN